MANEFPRMVTLLRKERGLSQKKVALDLNISQALLSHYEKGIRECGLDFMVKIADYFDVSCDYLLGRTTERSIGANGYSKPSAPAKAASSGSSEEKRTAALADQNRKLINDSISIIFELLEQTDNRGLTTEVSSYLMVTIYKMIRLIYSSNTKNPQAMFSVVPELYKGVSSAMQTIVETKISCLAAGRSAGEFNGISNGASLQLSPEILSRNYPDEAPSLYNLIRETEDSMKKLI